MNIKIFDIILYNYSNILLSTEYDVTTPGSKMETWKIRGVINPVLFYKHNEVTKGQIFFCLLSLWQEICLFFRKKQYTYIMSELNFK
jgi:type 1 glutamine amidotransferase